MNNGWIKLHRRLLDWEWISDPDTLVVFIHLLLGANHTEKTWKGVLIPRGSVLTGRKLLSLKTGLTERKIRTSLKKLESTSEVTIKTTNKYSLISINNYDIYQQNDQQKANERPASDQQVTTTKNDKKEKNVKNNNTTVFISLFNSLFGTSYKETSGRVKKLTLRLKTYSLEQILKATKNLASSDFHTGKNDRGWKADPDFLIRSDEQIDKWLNIVPKKEAKPKVFVKLNNNY